MTLFSSKEIAEENTSEKRLPSVIQDDTETRVVLFKHGDALPDAIGTIEKEKCIEYMSASAWSAHEILFYILKFTGPARVYLTTWTMTEYPARLLLDALSQGIIKELFCVMDVRMERSPNVMQLAKFNMTKIKLSHCHAKVIVVENDEWGVSVLSSQNITENPRIEAGRISSSKKLAAFHRDWIIYEIENGHALE